MQSSRSTDTDDDISVSDLWLILRRRWGIVIGLTLGAGAIAAAISLLMTPLYEAQTVIMEVDHSDQGVAGGAGLLSQFGGLAELAGLNVESLRRNKKDGRTLIESRTFLEEFLSRKDLLPALYPTDWDASKKAWKPRLDHPRTVWEGAEAFKRRVYKISVNPENGLMTLSIRWTDRDTAASWANELVALANEISRQKDVAEAEHSMAYLNKQIDQTNVVELRRVLYTLVENELRTLLLANARDDYGPSRRSCRRTRLSSESAANT